MSDFVGRAAERARLTALLDGAAAGRGRVVFITGEAGAGKSALIGQVRTDAMERLPDLLVLDAACSEQFGAGEPYQPFIEAFRDLLSETAEEGSRWEDIRKLAGELAPAWISAIPLAGGLIAATVSTAVELRRLGTGTAASEEALFFQYTELLLAAAAERPILLFLDDLHWADGASVSLLVHLARRIGSERVLIVGTLRPADIEVTKHPLREGRLELDRYSLAEEIALAPLDRDALRGLATRVLGGPPHRDLLAWSEARAGANPLFFQELLRWSADQGVAAARDGEWYLERVPDAIEVPRSASAAIERRLQRLDPETYRSLEYASVLGDDFEVTVVARLLDADELKLEESIESIARTHRLVQFVETLDLPDGDFTSVFRFAHSLIQDVLHANLQGKRRILLHRKTVEILESVYGAEAQSIAHRLAVHCDEGRLAERAVAFALAGADRASDVYAHRDAIGLLGRALKNAPGGMPRVEALRRLGEANRVIGKMAEAADAFREAQSIAEAESNEHVAVGLERRMLVLQRHMNLARERMEAELGRVLERARAARATAEQCHLLWLWSNLPGVDAERAIGYSREALELAEAGGDDALGIQARHALGRVLALVGPDPRDALAPLRECIAMLGDRDRMRGAAARNIIAIVHVKLGNYREAARAFEEAADTFDEIGDPGNEAFVLNNLAVLLTRLGEWDVAEEKLAESLRIARRMGAATRTLQPLENRASVAEARGDFATALGRWHELADQARQGGWWTAEVIGLAGAGRAHLALGDRDAAARELERGAALLPPDDTSSEASVAWHHLAARIAAMDGDIEASMRHLDRVEAGLARTDRYEWATAQVLRAELLAPHDAEAAAETVDEALAILEQLDTAPVIGRARAILERRTG